MSHFCVLVIGDNVAGQLAPYQENNMGDCPAEFMQFIDEEAEELEKYKTGTRAMIQLKDGRIIEPWDDQFKNPNHKLFDDHKTKYIYPKGSEEIQVKFLDMYKTFEEYMKDYHGRKERDPKTNRYGRWDNPNAKWDWYVIGGRWGGFYPLVKGAVGLLGEPSTFDKIGKDSRDKGKVDQALKKNIDFSKLKSEAEARATARYILTKNIFGGKIPKIKSWAKHMEDVENKVFANYDEARASYHAQPGCKKLQELQSQSSTLGLTNEQIEHLRWLDLGTYQCYMEEYVDRASKSAGVTFAVLYQGIWYERGQMGWWGAVHDEKDGDKWNEEFQKLLDGVSDDTLLTVVDCHI